LNGTKRKQKQILKKHKISFEEALTIFNDPLSITIDDPEHSSRLEKRCVDIGISSKNRILIISYTERRELITIISCRKATFSERKIYEEKKY
jgi:uncharacterized protein